MTHRSLRVVVVGHTHPDTAHVAGQRLPTFARVLAQRGHKIVLLTMPMTGRASTTSLEGLEARLAAHDWSSPLHVEALSTVKEDTSGGNLPVWLRKSRSALRLLTSGHAPEWTRGAGPLLPTLATTFTPDIVWAVFGSVSDLLVGQKLARFANCPWVIDFKDNWEAFIPLPFRGLLARRFADAAAATSNAEFHADVAARWFSRAQRPVVVYSGVAPEMFAPIDAARDPDSFRIVVIGALYDDGNLTQFLDGVRRWITSLAPLDRNSVELVYAGNDHTRFAAVAQGFDCAVRIERYLPLQALGRLTCEAGACAYLSSSRTFHHKLLELLASRRPVIAFPEEREESVVLSKRYGGLLRVCSTPDAVEAALTAAWREWRGGTAPVPTLDADCMTWEAMAESLEDVLQRVAHVMNRYVEQPTTLSDERRTGRRRLS